MTKSLQDRYLPDIKLVVTQSRGSDTVALAIGDRAMCQVPIKAWQELCRDFLVQDDNEILALACQHGIEPYLSPEGTDEMHCRKGELLAFAKAL